MSRKTLKANAVTSILGGNENGAPQASAIPLIFDEWFHGDFRTSRPSSYSAATGSKFPDEYNRSFPEYRSDSEISIGFDTTNGRTISNWGAGIGRSTAPITLDDEKYNPFRDEPALNFDGSNNYLGATIKGPYTRKEKITIKSSDGTTIEGVRASVILGGSDKYLEKAKRNGWTLKKLYELSKQYYNQKLFFAYFLSTYFIHITTFYTFLDAIYMADGAKLVRLWDASVYPAHDLYVNGTRRGGNQFREGIEWTRSGNNHSAFARFGYEGNRPGYTPFDRWGSFGYKTFWNRGSGQHPIADFVAQGTKLSESQITKAKPAPLFPSGI